jgi:hypothetical protein
LSRAALLTDYKNGFSLSESIVQIVEIVAFFPLVLFGLSRFGAWVWEKVEADEDAYFVLMFGIMAVKGVFAQNRGSAGHSRIYGVKLVFPRGDAATLLMGFNAKHQITGISLLGTAED